MTKGQFIYLVKTFFEGGDGGTGGSKRWHLGDIERYTEMGFADTVEQLYRQATRYHDWMHIDPLSKVYYNIPVTKDHGELVAKLPAPVLQLPESGGVRNVWVGSPFGDPVHLTPSGAQNVYCEIQKHDGRTGDALSGYIQGETVRIICPIDRKIERVSMRLIRSLQGYKETEEMPTVFGKDGIVFQTVIQMMAGIQPGDYVNDSSSQKVASNE